MILKSVSNPIYWLVSGSFDGAGGIGGLLARSHGYSAGAWAGHNFYHADGNGNVTMLIDNAGTPNVTAAYRYDPYGNSISATGTNAANNVYRFSSKERHASSGLYYYGYRFYDPNLQRWLNRDPRGEAGFELARSQKPDAAGAGLNLFRFVDNDPISRVDRFGLDLWDDTNIDNIGKRVRKDYAHWKKCGKPRCPNIDSVTQAICSCIKDKDEDPEKAAHCLCTTVYTGTDGAGCEKALKEIFGEPDKKSK